MIIAIASDDHPWPTGAHPDASAPHWAEAIRRAGHQVRWVDIYRADILRQLEGCDAFMWRHAHTSNMRQIASRLLPVIERELELPVYPDQNTCWHYDDKIAQAYLFDAHDLPSPRTWVWYDRDAAIDWCHDEADYPMIVKLWSGAGSANVGQVHNARQAEQHIRLLFDHGRFADDTQPNTWRCRVKNAGKAIANRVRRYPKVPSPYWDIHHNYSLFQEWLPGNDFDTRVTVIGNRAFAFRRFNRAGDFRASGSGNLDFSHEEIEEGFVRLAFTVAQRLRTQSCAIDGLYRGKEPVVCEISYTYSSRAVHRCPGHWVLGDGSPDIAELTWHDGPMRPETAQVDDFLQRLESR